MGPSRCRRKLPRATVRSLEVAPAPARTRRPTPHLHIPAVPCIRGDGWKLHLATVVVAVTGHDDGRAAGLSSTATAPAAVHSAWQRQRDERLQLRVHPVLRLAALARVHRRMVPSSSVRGPARRARVWSRQRSDSSRCPLLRAATASACVREGESSAHQRPASTTEMRALMSSFAFALQCMPAALLPPAPPPLAPVVAASAALAAPWMTLSIEKNMDEASTLARTTPPALPRCLLALPAAALPAGTRWRLAHAGRYQRRAVGVRLGQARENSHTVMLRHRTHGALSQAAASDDTKAGP